MLSENENIALYKQYLIEKELAVNTIKLYQKRAELFLKFLNHRMISKELILSYVEELKKNNKALTTMNKNIVALNSYLKFIGYKDCVVKTKRIQQRQSLENIISIQDYKKMLDYTKKIGNEKYYLIIHALGSTGIRVSELTDLTAEKLQDKIIHVNNKGKEREVYLSDALKEELWQYCHKKHITGPIFKGRGEHAISRVAVYKMLIKIAEKVGVPKAVAHPHSFRHMFAITYMNQYANISELANLLGHANLETTRIYLRLTVEEQIKKMNYLDL